MARLKIGSYILDSADSPSTSTTSGAVLDLDGDEPLRPEIDGDEYRWPVMYAFVSAATEALLKTAVDAIVAAITQCAGLAVVYEETSGTTLFEMHPNLWPDAVGETQVDYSGLSADIAFRLIGRRAGPLSSSAGSADEAGQIGTVNWQYEVSGGGIAGMVATCTFGPTLSGTTVTSGARQNAVAWINKLSNTANYPAWLNTNFRIVHSMVEFEQKANQASIAESSYDPCVATISFRELDSTLAAAAAWPAQAKSADWAVSVSDRDPIDERSGEFAGFDFELTGSVLLKTEGNTTFNSSETKLADGSIYSAANDAVNAVIAHFRAVYTTFSLVQMGGPRINVDAVQGVASFAVMFTSQTRIRAWEEEGEITNQWAKVWSRASDGTDWRYANEGGPIKVLTHRLRIVALDAPQPYRAPTLGDPNWDEVEVSQKPKIGRKYSNGQMVYTTEGECVWRYVNPSPTNVSPDDKYASNPRVVGWDSIGNGDVK